MADELDVTRLVISIVLGYLIIFLMMWLFRKRKKSEIIESEDKK